MKLSKKVLLLPLAIAISLGNITPLHAIPTEKTNVISMAEQERKWKEEKSAARKKLAFIVAGLSATGFTLCTCLETIKPALYSFSLDIKLFELPLLAFMGTFVYFYLQIMKEEWQDL